DRIFPVRSIRFSDVTSDEYGASATSSRDSARSLLLRAQEYQSQYYNTRHRNVLYYPGNLVWLRIPTRHVGLSTKLLQKFYGPYRILRRTSPVNYEIESLDSRHQDVVHVDRLKAYYHRTLLYPSNNWLQGTAGFLAAHTLYP